MLFRLTVLFFTVSVTTKSRFVLFLFVNRALKCVWADISVTYRFVKNTSTKCGDRDRKRSVQKLSSLQATFRQGAKGEKRKGSEGPFQSWFWIFMFLSLCKLHTNWVKCHASPWQVRSMETHGVSSKKWFFCLILVSDSN